MIYFVFYTDWFIPTRFAAMTYGPFIFIRPTRKGDVGLLEHEKVHVRQFWRNPFFGIPYLLSKKARFAYEVEAYREQMKHSPENIKAYASALADKYNVGVTFEEALETLNEAPTWQ